MNESVKVLTCPFHNKFKGNWQLLSISSINLAIVEPSIRIVHPVNRQIVLRMGAPHLYLLSICYDLPGLATANERPVDSLDFYVLGRFETEDDVLSPLDFGDVDLWFAS
jgi:hypothetical protein